MNPYRKLTDTLTHTEDGGNIVLVQVGLNVWRECQNCGLKSKVARLPR